MVYRGRGNPRARGFIRPFRARGRGRRPFPFHGQSRGFNRGFGRGGHPTDEGLRITLRNPGRRDEEEYGQRSRSHEREPDRRENYDEYKEGYGGEHSHEYEQETRFDEERASPHGDPGRSPPRKRPHVESDLIEEESLRITVGNDRYEEQFSDRRDPPPEWEQEGRERGERWHEDRRDRRSEDDRRRRDEPYEGGRRDWDDTKPPEKWDDRGSDNYRGRGRGYFNRGYDPNYRGRGRGDFRGGFRGRGRGSYEPHERDGRGRGFCDAFDRGRGRGGYSPHDRHSFDSDFDRHGHLRRSLSRGRSRSRGRYSQSPDRRRSRSRSLGRRRRSRSRDRRSYSRGRRSYSRDRRSGSRDRRSRSRGRRSGSRHRRSRSGSRSYSSRSRSHSRNRSLGRRSYSRSHSLSPVRRGPSRPQSMGREVAGGMPSVAERSPGRSPPRSRSQGPSHSRVLGDRRSHSRRRDRSSSSSSSSSTDSRSRGSPPALTEQQYEEEMYRRLKSELSSNIDPKEREERIAKHIREMAKLSPALFRQFMAKNAGNLSAMALMQQGEQQGSDEVEPAEPEPVPPDEPSDSPSSKPLRSILKRKTDSTSPTPERSPSPPPLQPSALSQIEKVIQTLRKGGVKQQEEKPVEKEEGAPPPTGALRQLSSYMDIEDEEEFLYGDGPRKGGAQPEPGPLSAPFWSAHQFEDNLQPGTFDPSRASRQFEHKHLDPAPMVPAADSPLPKKHPFDILENFLPTVQKPEQAKLPLAFSSFEEKEKSYEQWRAAVFQKQAPENPKELAPLPVPQPSAPEGAETAEQLSSTVENILKSIGFNFELSQRMQELARQKKEGEQEAILINQSASFLGADSDALTEDLTSVFQKEQKPVVPPVDTFMKEVEAATRVAREKAVKAKEAEKRRTGRGAHNPSIEEDLPRGRDRELPSRRDSGGFRDGKERGEASRRTRRDSVGAEALTRFSVSGTADHSPYDPSVQDYPQAYQPGPQYSHGEFGYSDYELYSESDYFQNPHQPKPIRTSNLIELGGEGGGAEDSNLSRSKGFSDFDKNTGDVGFKRAGERILIVKKKEDKDKVDSPGSDTNFSRRIVLPPKEKGKAPQVRTPDSDSHRDVKRRASSPESPRRSKHSRRSPSVEDRPSDRIIFQKTKSTRQPEPSRSESYKKETDRSPSPQRFGYESKYKYQASKGDSKSVDPKAKPEPSKPDGRTKLEFIKSKLKQELPKTSPKSEAIKAEVARAARVAEDKVRLLEKKKKLLTLERELTALRQQHNELLRKRRRQKDGHKDPLLAENSKLQDEIVTQIKLLREGKELPSADLASSGKPKPAAVESSSSQKVSSASSSNVEKTEKEALKIHYEYFDPGSHWCSTCNLMCGHMFDFFKHLESKKHQQKVDPFNRPWLMEAMQKSEKKPKPQGQVQAHPIKGLEFMMATAAFYCSLCSEFCGDLSIAESHMKSEEHHEKYRDYLSQHPYYEKRYMLERSAALSMQKRLSPEDTEDHSDASDGDKEHPDRAKKKASSKSDSRSSEKDNSEDRQDKKHKSLYSDYEEEHKMRRGSKERDRRDSKERDRHRSRGGSSEHSSRNAKDRWDSRVRRDSTRERREGSKERHDSREHSGKDLRESEKKNNSKPQATETSVGSKTANSSALEGKADNKDKSVSDISEKTTGEELKKEGEDKKEVEAKKEREAKGEGEGKKEGEAETKGKIPIKLTGKSGIKPASTLPPWKVLTRPIPKSTMQKRLLGSRLQPPSANVLGPALPNEDPVPLDDFLTVGVKKSTPVPVMPDLVHIPVPPHPRMAKMPGEESKKKQEEENEKLEEMQLLGIDPESLVPAVKPRAPPPPSQNLSLPPDQAAAGAGSSEADLGAAGRAKDGPAQPEEKTRQSSSDSDSSRERPEVRTASSSESEQNVPWKPMGKGASSDSGSSADKGKKKAEAGTPASATHVEVKEEASKVTTLPPAPPPKVPAPEMVPVPPQPPLPSVAPPLQVPPQISFPPLPLPRNALLPTPDTSIPPPGFMCVPPPGFVPPLPGTSMPVPGWTPPLPYAPPPPLSAPPPPPEPPAPAPQGAVQGPALPQGPSPPSPVQGPPQGPTPQSPVQRPAPPQDAVQGPALPQGPAPQQDPSHPQGVTPEQNAGELQASSPPQPSDATAQVTITPGRTRATKSRTRTPQAAAKARASARKAAAARKSGAAGASLVQGKASTSSPPEPVQGTPASEETAEVSAEVATSTNMPESAAAGISKEIPAETVPAQAAASTSENLEPATVVEPQPSGSGLEVAPSCEEAQPTSTQAPASPMKKPAAAAAQRARAARKSSMAPPKPAEEPTQPDAAGEQPDAPVPTTKRPRTRSQARPQPQRQTRSRTRQQKTEEDEVSVTASDEGSPQKSAGEAASSMAQEAESADSGKASSTSACVLDLTNPPADSSGRAEASTEVTSSSCAVKAGTTARESPPAADSALNLTVSPQARGSRQGRVEQMMPEDLSSYAEPQDLTTSSAGKGKGRRPPEMPIDLTMRLAPSQSVGSSQSEQSPQVVEMQPSPGSQISSSEGLQRGDSLDHQTVKDTLLSSTSAMNPSTSNLSELEMGDEGGVLEAAPAQLADSPGLGVDPQGDLVDFSLAPVDFEELVDMQVEDSSAGVSAAPDTDESGGTADSTFTPD